MAGLASHAVCLRTEWLSLSLSSLSLCVCVCVRVRVRVRACVRACLQAKAPAWPTLARASGDDMCAEAAAIGDKVTLPPGGSVMAGQTLQAC